MPALRIDTSLQHKVTLDSASIALLIEALGFTSQHKSGASPRMRPLLEVFARFQTQMVDYEPLLAGLRSSTDPRDTPKIPDKEQVGPMKEAREEKPNEPNPPAPGLPDLPAPPPPPPFKIEPPAPPPAPSKGEEKETEE